MKYEFHNQDRFAEPQGAKWQGHPKGETPPTDNDAWDRLLRAGQDLGKELAAVKRERDALRAHLAAVEVDMRSFYDAFTRWHKIETKEEMK